MNKIGIMIMSGFATLWFVWGLSAVQPINGLWLVVPFAVSGAMVSAAMRLPMSAGEADRRRTGKVVGWASGIEGVAIFFSINVLTNLGHGAYGVVAALAIVGLHFLPLAYFLAVPAYYVTAASMVGLALFGCTVAADATRLLVLGTGAAVLLWLTCLTCFAKQPARAIG